MAILYCQLIPTIFITLTVTTKMEENDMIDITLHIKTYINQELLDLANFLWKKLDKGATGFVSLQELPRMLRLLGQFITRLQPNRENYQGNAGKHKKTENIQVDGGVEEAGRGGVCQVGFCGTRRNKGKGRFGE